jgi:periplasmic protein TonB
MLADLNRRQRRSSRGLMLSVAAHAAILLALAIAIHRAPRVATFRLPGTPRGVTLLTWYSPGSQKPIAADTSVHSKQTHSDKPSHRKIAEQPTPPEPPHADAGSGNITESGIGEGDIRIALSQNSPSPKPDLSMLAHGTKGDVILDAVIDEHGRIAQLTLVQGLGPSIDETVIATVKQWLFTPATKDGVPVASEQEFRFHYERG